MGKSKILNIAVESIDFMGKSTLVSALQRAIKARGVKCITASLMGGRDLTTGKYADYTTRKRIETLRYKAKNTDCDETRQRAFDDIALCVKQKADELDIGDGFCVILWDRHAATSYAYAGATDRLTPLRYEKQVSWWRDIDKWVYIVPDLTLMRQRQADSPEASDKIESMSDEYFRKVIHNFELFFEHLRDEGTPTYDISPEANTADTVETLISSLL